MLKAGDWIISQQNLITFVLVDADGNEVTGLGDTFDLEISQAGGSFNPGAGTKAEIGSGGYSYLATIGEASTRGPVLIRITGAGIVSQWLEYVVEGRNSGAVLWTYYVDDTDGNPLQGVEVEFKINGNGVWVGMTDAFGYAKDLAGNDPRLDPGTYTITARKPGFVFPDDTEVVA